MTHSFYRITSRTGADDSLSRQAYLLLRTVFTIEPIAFGLDKFFGILTDREQYLAPWVNNIVPGTAHQAMLAVGVVESAAGSESEVGASR